MNEYSGTVWAPSSFKATVFPPIRPAGIIFLQGLQLRVSLERGYYSRAGIIK